MLPSSVLAPIVQARNRQAMNEIRKVINWAQQMPTAATTPPHPLRPGSSASRRGPAQMHLETGSIPGSPAGSHYGELLAVEQQQQQQHEAQGEQLEEQGRSGALLLPGSNSSSGRHHSSHGRQHGHHHAEHRYGEPLGSAPVSRAGSEAGSAAGRRTGKGPGSPSKLAARAGEMMPLMLQASEELAAETAAGEQHRGSAAYCQRDTAGGAPASPALSEAASSPACVSLGSRGRVHRVGGPGSPTRVSGTKQQLAAALAAAGQHKLPPDQQHHHHAGHHTHAARVQERYAAEVEDDTLGAPGPEDSFEEAQGGHAYGSRGGVAGGDRWASTQHTHTPL